MLGTPTWYQHHVTKTYIILGTRYPGTRYQVLSSSTGMMSNEKMVLGTPLVPVLPLSNNSWYIQVYFDSYDVYMFECKYNHTSSLFALGFNGFMMSR